MQNIKNPERGSDAPGYADMRQDDLVVILASKARAALEEEQ